MNKRVVGRLLKYIAPYRAFLILSLICAFASVACTLLAPVFIGDAVDLIVSKDNVGFDGIPPILVKLALTVAAGAVFGWLSSYFNNLITYRTVKDMRVKLFDKLSSVPLSYVDSNPHGDLINRVTNDIDLVSDGLLHAFTQLFTGVATILGTLGFMLSVSPLITVAVVVLTPLSLFVASFIAKGSFKYFSAQTSAQGEILGFLNEYVGCARLIKAFCHEKSSRDKFGGINSKLYDCGLKAQIYSAIANPSTRFVNGLVYAAVGVIGGLLCISGSISVGGLSMFLSYANQYTKPFNEISGIVTQLQTALASASRVFDILDAKSEPEDGPDAAVVKPSDCSGHVKLENVCFSYSSDRKLIENLCLDAAPGSRIAIVGPTGCGKTTLINLLMRFYDVDSGRITIDGTDCADIRRDSLRSLYGMVLQETWLLNGTVRENIAYGRPGATDDEIKAAAKKARAHGFIRRLPDGYDTVITEDGGNLSQGQKQLLCIARVMLCDTPMLILDEATSNIDTRTEISVQRAFSEMMKGRTSFVVAHRLSTIREADQILVMRDGKIIEQGRHGELISKNGFYAGLYRAMSGKI